MVGRSDVETDHVGNRSEPGTFLFVARAPRSDQVLTGGVFHASFAEVLPETERLGIPYWFTDLAATKQEPLAHVECVLQGPAGGQRPKVWDVHPHAGPRSHETHPPSEASPVTGWV